MENNNEAKKEMEKYNNNLEEDKEKQIENFLIALRESFSGMNQKTHWPLNAAQISAYFDADEALDIYNRLNKLKETWTIEQIAKLMPNADIIRNFITNDAIVGLKVARKFNMTAITQKDITDYTNFLIDILKTKVKSDPLCLDGKNYYHTEEEINTLVEKINFEIPSKENKKELGILTSLANNFCYTLFFDVFMVGGFVIHGPYDVSKRFGEGAVMLIRDYHNLFPKELWPELEMPFKNMKILAVYKNLEIKMNFVNHAVTQDTIADKLIAYKIYTEDKEVSPKKIQNLIEFFSQKTIEQTKKIRALSDLDKVRKGAEIAFYLFRELRKSMGDDWMRKEYLEAIITKFGTTFIEKYNLENKPKKDLEDWIRVLDPRIPGFE